MPFHELLSNDEYIKQTHFVISLVWKGGGMRKKVTFLCPITQFFTKCLLAVRANPWMSVKDPGKMGQYFL